MQRFLHVDDIIRQHSELGVKERSIGDTLCWTFQLDTGNRSDKSTFDSHDLNLSWSIRYSKINLDIQEDVFLPTDDVVMDLMTADNGGKEAVVDNQTEIY